MYTPVGRVTEFKYGRLLSRRFTGQNRLKSLRRFGEPYGMLPSEMALVFVDNHDNQRGDKGRLTFRQPRAYRVRPYLFALFFWFFFFFGGGSCF